MKKKEQKPQLQEDKDHLLLPHISLMQHFMKTTSSYDNHLIMKRKDVPCQLLLLVVILVNLELDLNLLLLDVQGRRLKYRLRILKGLGRLMIRDRCWLQGCQWEFMKLLWKLLIIINKRLWSIMRLRMRGCRARIIFIWRLNLPAMVLQE